MADLDLDAIEARAAAATPGPWHYDDGVTDETGERGKLPSIEARGPVPLAATQPATIADPIPGVFPNWLMDANGRFIAAARDDVPTLVAECRRLRSERDTLRDALAALTSVASSLLPHATRSLGPRACALLSKMAHRARAVLEVNRG